MPLTTDQYVILRSKGRLSNADLPFSSKFPAILPREQHITNLIVKNCHDCVYHCGVKDTLVELWSHFWIIQGRQYIKRIVSTCVVCRCLEGKAFSEPMRADLPEFRVQATFAFTTVGTDYLGPLIIKAERKPKEKVWVHLFSRNTSCAIHVEIVPDLSTEAFLHCLQQFMAHRRIPRLITSNNVTNFKGASKILLGIYPMASSQSEHDKFP